MIVETIKKGECTIVIHDDAYIGRSPEEIQRTIQNASSIVCASARKSIVKDA